MRSKAALAALRDMDYHITEGFTDERFRADLRIVYAVTRSLEIISERRGDCQLRWRRGIRQSRGRT
jgi:uncharacterized protein with HEPN domain